jgi:hypothetical protein
MYSSQLKMLVRKLYCNATSLLAASSSTDDETSEEAHKSEPLSMGHWVVMEPGLTAGVVQPDVKSGSNTFVSTTRGLEPFR